MLENCYDNSKWTSPSFGILKKNNTIRVFSNFRRLNAAIKHSPWPMPTIRELYLQCSRMIFATAIDQVKGNWGIKVARRSQKCLTIISSWGKYYYKRLLMGLSISVDVFQREMLKLLEGIEGALVYIDDLLLVTCRSYEHHLEQLKKYEIK